MKKLVVNSVLWILFTLMQCGPIVGTMEYGAAGGPMETLWLMAPFSLLCLALVVFTTRYAVPRLLLNQKWGAYAALEFALSYVLSLIEQLIIVYIWTRWEIMPAGHRLDWGWLAVNAFCNSLMLFFALLAVGGWYLYDSARADLRKEQRLTARIEGHISAVKRMLRPDALSRRLGAIADKVTTAPLEAEKDIDELASELRESLYNLPAAPAEDAAMTVRDEDNNSVNMWLTSRRYRAVRVIAFQLSLICICFGAFFATPDQPEFGPRFAGFLVLLGMFELIAGIDIYVFFRSFRRTRRRGRFIIASAQLAVVMILPILVERVALYLDNRCGDYTHFILVTSLATLASVLMVLFYVAGIGAVLLYQDWVRHTRRLIMLQASTKRLEYASLKKQINPHFLFNILNSASVLTMADAADARAILLELRELIDYQFRETERPTVSLTETLTFLNAYLMLEATRKIGFSFKITCDGDMQGVEVPSLLFIPFVENAVKYADGGSEREGVRVRFEVKGLRLIFECENPVGELSSALPLPTPASASSASVSSSSPGNPSAETGGLGIANTLRRLELLYDDDFTYSVRRSGGRYRVALSIPLSGYRLSDD